MRATFLNEASRALQAVRELIDEAARLRVDLLVLPECAYPAYLLGSKASYREAGCLHGEEFLAVLQDAAHKKRLHIVSGFIHEVGERLYNGAALISPGGEILGIYHKSLLWNVDSRWFEPGEEVRAIDSDLGRVGMLICADARIPELVATLAADGAGLIALPTCWINTASRPGEYYNPQSDFLIRARSFEFGLPFACANKCGVETGNTGYNGQSMITAGDGTVLVQADGESQGVFCAQVEPGAPASVPISPRRREMILAPPREIARQPGGLRRAKVALMSGRVVRAVTGLPGSGPDRAAAERLFKPLQEAAISLLVARASDENVAERLTQWGSAYSITVAAYPDRLGPETGSAFRIGKVSGQAARSFPAIRALALQGAGMVCVFDASAGLNVLRGRALENRVFLAVVGESEAKLIGVNGELPAPIGSAQRITGHGTDGEAYFEIDPSSADDKCVAPGTDVFAQRRPSSYRLGCC